MVLKDFRNRYKNSAMGLVCNGEILYLSNHYTNFKYIWLHKLSWHFYVAVRKHSS